MGLLLDTTLHLTIHVLVPFSHIKVHWTRVPQAVLLSEPAAGLNFYTPEERNQGSHGPCKGEIQTYL